MSIKALRKAIKQNWRELRIMRLRYAFADDVDLKKYRRDILDRMLWQVKMMQEELDERLNRG